MATTSGIKAGKAFVIIGAVDKTGQVLGRVSNRLKAFGQRIQNFGRDLATKGLAAAIPAGLAAKAFLTFDDAMRKVKARAGATKSEFESLREQAKKLGRETSFSATQVANLQAILARRGFVPKEIEEQIPNILNFARAAGEGADLMQDLADAATLTAGTIAAFGLKTSQSGDIADTFAAAVNNSALSMQGLLESLKFVAPIAKSGGLSLQQTVQTLGELSNLWIENSQGGTVFRRMILQLIQKNKDLTKAGIRLEAEGGGFRPLTDIIRDISEAVKDLSKLEQLDVFRKIFAARGITGAAGLTRQTQNSIKLADALAKRFGLAKKTAEEMDRGIGGAFRRFISAVNGVAIEIGESFAPALIDTGKNITDHLNLLAEWIQENRGVIQVVGLTIVGVIATGAALITLGIALKIAALGVGVLALAFTTLKFVLIIVQGLFLFLLTVPGILVGASIAFLAFVGKVSGAFDEILKGFSGIGETVKATFKGIMDAFAIRDFQAAWDILVLGLEITWLQFVDTLRNAWQKFTTFFVEAWIGTVLVFKQVWFNTQKLIGSAFFSLIEIILGAIEGLLKTIGDIAPGLKAAEALLGTGPTKVLGEAKDIVISARDILGQDIERSLRKAGIDAAEAFKDAGKGIEEDQAQKEIEERKFVLEGKLRDVAIRRDEQQLKAKEADEAIEAAKDAKDERFKDLGDDRDTRAPLAAVAPTISRGLEIGTVEAAKKFAENRNAIQQIELAKQQLDEQKKGNALLMALGDGEGGSV